MVGNQRLVLPSEVERFLHEGGRQRAPNPRHAPREGDAMARIIAVAVKIRLGELEERLHPSTYITDAQAAEIQSAVATVAMALTQRDPSKNHFQAIHAELHRRFKARSYSLIRVEQYAAVLAFLAEWDRAMDAGGAPGDT
jgi:ORF6C domain-containing protein